MLWEKKKLLVASNFSFSRSVFKRLVLQICKNQGLFGKGLKVKVQKNIGCNEENDLSKYFLLFPLCF